MDKNSWGVSIAPPIQPNPPRRGEPMNWHKSDLNDKERAKQLSECLKLKQNLASSLLILNERCMQAKLGSLNWAPGYLRDACHSEPDCFNWAPSDWLSATAIAVADPKYTKKASGSKVPAIMRHNNLDVFRKSR